MIKNSLSIMAHSFSKIWLHLVFSTKNREPLINESLEKPLYDFMWTKLNEIGCTGSIINGIPDHVHILFKLNPQKAVTEIVKQIKGSSSHWVNHDFKSLHNSQPVFAWQTGYGIFSVSESQLTKAHGYIKNQKEHHKKQSFLDEYQWFLKAHGFQWVEE